MWDYALAVLALATMYLAGRWVGRQAAPDSTSTVIVINLDGEHVGTVKIDGVLVVPNASYVRMTPPPPGPPEERL